MPASPSRSTPAWSHSWRPSTSCWSPSRRASCAGGFGSAVWETLSDAGLGARILRVGLPDRYVTHGAPKLLHEEVGFTGQRIAERVLAAVADSGDGNGVPRWSGRITQARQ